MFSFLQDYVYMHIQKRYIEEKDSKYKCKEGDKIKVQDLCINISSIIYVNRQVYT